MIETIVSKHKTLLLVKIRKFEESQLFHPGLCVCREVGLCDRSDGPLLDCNYSFTVLRVASSPSRKPIQNMRLNE